MCADPCQTVLVVSISSLVASEDEIDATLGPVHISGTVIEPLFPVDTVFEFGQEVI